MTHATNPNAPLPVGTQVVLRAEVKDRMGRTQQPIGAVGVIIKAPADHLHTYRIRFPDGLEASLFRRDLAVRKHIQGEGLSVPDPMREYDLFQHVIYRCMVGSRAYGLHHAESDEDRRGIYLPPAEMHWALYGLPEQLENPGTEECYWELQKFLTLALKANPNVLECLYTPIIERATPLAEELLAQRSIFLSKLIYQTYNGYVLSQFKKLEGDIRNHGSIRWKHAMHLIRLLISGITALKEATIPVDVGEYRERLLAIRRGELPWEEINEWRLGLHRDFDAAFQATKLPERPDYERANVFLIKARRSMVSDE